MYCAKRGGFHRVLVGGLPTGIMSSLAARVALVSERSTPLSSGVSDDAEVIVWSEPLTSDYPDPTLVSNSAAQRPAYVHYWDHAVTLDSILVSDIRDVARKHKAMIMGTVTEPGSGSTYGTLLAKTSSPVREAMLRAKATNQEGGSRIIAPSGDTVGGPAIGDEGIVAARLTTQAVVGARQNLVGSGRGSRPDILRLEVLRLNAVTVL